MGGWLRRLAVFGLCWAAFALRIWGLDFQSLWRDEVDAIRFASRPLSGLLQTFVSPGENGPLFYLLLRPWLNLAGESEFSLRFFSVAAGVLAVPLIYRVARQLLGRSLWPALVAALLAVTAPYLVWYSQEGKMYALTVVLVLLSMDRFLTATRQGGWYRWLSYVVVTSMAFYVHVAAALIIPAQMVIFFLFDGWQERSRWKPWLLSVAALTLPYMPLVAWQLPLLFEPGFTGYRFVPLHEMVGSLLVSFSLGVVPRSTFWNMVPFAALLLAGALSWRELRPGAGMRGVVLIWLSLPVIVFFLVTLARPLYTARYLVFVMPAYLFMLALGMKTIGRRSKLLGGLLLGAMLVANGIGLWRQATTPIKADFRGATQYVIEHASPQDLLIFQIPYGRHPFEYYARRLVDEHQLRRAPAVHPIGEGEPGYHVFLPCLVVRRGGPLYRWTEGLYTNAGTGAETVDRRMTDLVAGSEVVWLVATEVAMWDERELVRGWLDQHALLTDESQYVRVAVYRYRMP